MPDREQDPESPDLPTRENSGDRSEDLPQVSPTRPPSSPGSSRDVSTPPGPARVRSPLRLLVVDDEEMILGLYRRMLTRQGYVVTACACSVEALRRFQADPHAFDLLLTDHVMPGLVGTELAEQCRRIRPDLPVLLVTGAVDPTFDRRRAVAAVDVVLWKPVERARLVKALERLLDRRAEPSDSS